MDTMLVYAITTTIANASLSYIKWKLNCETNIIIPGVLLLLCGPAHVY